MALIKPIPVSFSPEVMDRLWSYVEGQIDFLDQQSTTFKTSVVPEWTRLLKGIPKTSTKNFPFPNASNLVIQLIATRVEQMLSRAMVMYEIDPLWTINALGDLVGQESEEQARVLEQFLGDMAVDPEELALYRTEEIFIHDSIAYGTAFMGLPWQYITEHVGTDLGGDSKSVTPWREFPEFIRKDGPTPENIPITRILIDNKVTDIEKARFVAKELILTREAIEDRMAFGVWSKEMGERVLQFPDESGVELSTLNNTKQIDSVSGKWGAVYKVYECYFKFVHDKKTFSIIAHWHRASKAKLSVVFNYLPKNMLPIVDLRFGYDGESYYGYGFCEMLEGYQQEVSSLHNNRLDNEAIRNNVTFRINKDSELASTLKFFPGVVIPADEGEVEILDTKAGNMDNMQSESASISMTNERSGVDPAITGNGSGIVNNKRGIYSSQGTLAVLQQQNNRTGLRMMDIRATHTKIGRKLLQMYGNLGIGDRLKQYGEQAPALHKALDSVKAGNIGLALRGSGGNSNVEAARQNSILLQGLQEKYFQTVNAILAQIEQPQIAPDVRTFLIDVLFAEQSLTRDIFRVFGKFNVDTLIPFPQAIKNERFKQQSNQQGTGTPQPAQNSVPTGNGLPVNTVPTSNEGQQG